MPMPVRNLMHAINRSKIIDTIRTAGMMSRVDISRHTGLSRASVTGLTAELIQEGLIIEKKIGHYKGGRPPMLLALNPEGAYAVGVKMSVTELRVVIVDFEGNVIASRAYPLEPVYHPVTEIAERIVSAVQSCIWESNFSKERISGVGIGVPGLVDAGSGNIRFLPNYGWENVNLRDLVQAGLKHPCYIDNSSNTLALAEQWFGLGKGIDNFLVVTIENGVGLGAVLGGRLYRGADGTAGEFGHMPLDDNGPLCRCGKKGCLETYLGIIYLLQEARKEIKAESQKKGAPKKSTIDHFEGIIQTARKGNPALREMFVRAGQALGTGISHLIALFSPSKIIITGRGVQAGELIFDPMEATLNGYQESKFGRGVTEVVIQEWTDQDWARGAGVLVLRELYKSPVSQVAMDK